MQRHTKGKMWKRWWLFQATDFQSLMYPCFIFCRTLGIFPYKLKGLTFEVSKPRYILSTTVICIYSIFLLILIYNIIISKINFGEITTNLHVFNHHVLSGFIVIITYVLSGVRMNLLQTLLEISSKLPPDTYQKLSRLIHVKDILFITLRLIHIYFNIYKVSDFHFNIILLVILSMYSALLELQMNMLYINCVCILKACFKRINDNLKNVQIMINDLKRSNLKLIYHIQRNQFLLIELKIHKKQHLMVTDAVKMLNKSFSLQLLASIIMIFSKITFELYYYVVRWRDGVFISLDRQFLDVFLTSMVYNILNITLLVWACETSKDQAQTIVTTIHDLLNSTNDEQITKEMQLFSLQILHCKIAFSAKGLTVDATLLAKIVGTITTYLLILVQFLNISHSCDETTKKIDIQSN